MKILSNKYNNNYIIGTEYDIINSIKPFWNLTNMLKKEMKYIWLFCVQWVLGELKRLLFFFFNMNILFISRYFSYVYIEDSNDIDLNDFLILIWQTII